MVTLSCETWLKGVEARAIELDDKLETCNAPPQYAEQLQRAHQHAQACRSKLTVENSLWEFNEKMMAWVYALDEVERIIRTCTRTRRDSDTPTEEPNPDYPDSSRMGVVEECVERLTDDKSHSLADEPVRYGFYSRRQAAVVGVIIYKRPDGTSTGVTEVRAVNEPNPCYPDSCRMGVVEEYVERLSDGNFLADLLADEPADEPADKPVRNRFNSHRQAAGTGVIISKNPKARAGYSTGAHPRQGRRRRV